MFVLHRPPPSMATPYAFVTLLTSDSYLQGALTLAAALRDVHSSPAVLPEVEFETVCLVTPETVDVSTIKLLRRAFDVVLGVEIISQKDSRNLTLLGTRFYAFQPPTLIFFCRSSRSGHSPYKTSRFPSCPVL